MISHVHSTTVVFKDQAAAVDFYTNVLGFEVIIDQQMGPDMRFVTVAPKGAVTAIALAHESWAGDIGSPGGNTGISLITTDIDETYKTLSARGVRFKGEIETMPWGDKAVWFYDLEDNEFFLNESK